MWRLNIYALSALLWLMAGIYMVDGVRQCGISGIFDCALDA